MSSFCAADCVCVCMCAHMPACACLCLLASLQSTCHAALSHTASMGPPQVLRVNAEWRRWEEADKWNWDEGKRRRWAEGLWRAQQGRKLRMRSFLRQQELAAARQRWVRWLGVMRWVHASRKGGKGMVCECMHACIFERLHTYVQVCMRIHTCMPGRAREERVAGTRRKAAPAYAN